MCDGFNSGVAPLQREPQYDVTLFRRNHPSASTPGPEQAIAADMQAAIALGRAVVVAKSDTPWTQEAFEHFTKPLSHLNTRERKGASRSRSKQLRRGRNKRRLSSDPSPPR